MAAHILRSARRPAAHRRATRLDEHLPVDHRLSRVYRVGAGLMGLVLLAFGILGLIDKIGFFDTGGDTVAGLSTNGALSVLSICVGLLLFIGMVIGGNFASSLNMVLGIAFILSGFANLALLDTGMNFLAFQIQNVLFSFVAGLLLMLFGMYGRVSGGLPTTTRTGGPAIPRRPRMRSASVCGGRPRRCPSSRRPPGRGCKADLPAEP